ncbi:hypothetical protein ACLOJK_006527 [Asimina triloba]
MLGAMEMPPDQKNDAAEFQIRARRISWVPAIYRPEMKTMAELAEDDVLPIVAGIWAFNCWSLPTPGSVSPPICLEWVGVEMPGKIRGVAVVGLLDGAGDTYSVAIEAPWKMVEHYIIVLRWFCLHPDRCCIFVIWVGHWIVSPPICLEWVGVEMPGKIRGVAVVGLLDGAGDTYSVAIEAPWKMVEHHIMRLRQMMEPNHMLELHEEMTVDEAQPRAEAPKPNKAPMVEEDTRGPRT